MDNHVEFFNGSDGFWVHFNCDDKSFAINLSNGNDDGKFGRPFSLAMVQKYCNGESGTGLLKIEDTTLRARLAQVEGELRLFREAEKTTSDAYLRIRGLLGAWDTPHGPTPEQVYAHTEAKLSELITHAEKAEQFRDAVIDALVVSHIYIPEHDTNPRKALNDLIRWEQKIALDPLVSSDARALIERGRKEAEQENARLREALAWRPIETAPHHDWILLDCGNAGIVEGCYSTFEKEDAPRWFDSYGRTIYGPLHWIPLLDTPAARTALGGE